MNMTQKSDHNSVTRSYRNTQLCIMWKPTILQKFENNLLAVVSTTLVKTECLYTSDCLYEKNGGWYFSYACTEWTKPGWQNIRYPTTYGERRQLRRGLKNDLERSNIPETQMPHTDLFRSRLQSSEGFGERGNSWKRRRNETVALSMKFAYCRA